MHVKRSKLHGSYTQVANAVLRDRRLSFMARGILVFLLSLPDGARQDAHTLADQHPGLGRRGVSKALDELITHGYYVRRAVRDPLTGRVRTETAVFDTPQNETSQVAPMTAMPSNGGPTGGDAVKNPKGFKTQEENKTPNPAPPSEVREPLRPVAAPVAGGEGSTTSDKTAACAALVARLGRVEPRLTVGMQEMPKVAPLVAEWLDRGATEGQIRAVLATGLPDDLRSPVALIIHRLKAKMPARIVAAPQVIKAPAVECPDCARPVARPGRCSLCVAESSGRKPGPVADVARHVAMARELLTRRAVVAA
ncbi:helix-turn-helix domain-containing protein [Streptosporangium sp. NBC_01639]|uniref:hypothetical protein n=1 Tax=Streptosporangium sp. NBC_01639 TaxID=2975948 RepID=UPI00386D2B18|nr:helix-turn-helix domain-containing protein [Streptosporangium sp. NBC_01639]